ncbi:MAG: hypothetical protein A3F17_05660 [Gammaproteobacteria bacterium RIFCSPHIGHO2_12_FULL_41_15]|nr:MAG: hypothetical protein A3F17_05660 [Gammaproteobacteria bacterium RIFCSPHIGHO2_12_FULL_41_15]
MTARIKTTDIPEEPLFFEINFRENKMTKTVLTTYGFGLTPNPDDASNNPDDRSNANPFCPEVTVKRTLTGEVVAILDPDGTEEVRPMTPEEKKVIDGSKIRKASLPSDATARHSALFLDRQEDALITGGVFRTIQAAKAAQWPVPAPQRVPAQQPVNGQRRSHRR